MDRATPVGPKAFSSTVRRDPQYGQVALGATSIGAAPGPAARQRRPASARPGGAKPLAARARRPCSVIRSAVHGTAKLRLTTTRSIPEPGPVTSGASSSDTVVRIMSRAGQPMNVGRSSTSSRPPATVTRPTIPRSTIEIAGISGSTTPARICQARSTMPAAVPGSTPRVVITMSRPDPGRGPS